MLSNWKNNFLKIADTDTDAKSYESRNYESVLKSCEKEKKQRYRLLSSFLLLQILSSAALFAAILVACVHIHFILHTHVYLSLSICLAITSSCPLYSFLKSNKLQSLCIYQEDIVCCSFVDFLHDLEPLHYTFLSADKHEFQQLHCIFFWLSFVDSKYDTIEHTQCYTNMDSFITAFKCANVGAN